jgi:hypothetical protein
MSFLRLMEESVKETETPVAEETAVLPVHAPVKKHSVGGLIKDMWPAYLIEIFVIIFGISITLGLEEWRDKSRENHIETIYLKNLLSNVESDLRALKNTSLGTQKLLDRGNELLGYIRNPVDRTIPSVQLNEDVRAILSRPKFLTNDATFSDLKSSGNLRLINDIQLKNLLFAYYSQTQDIRDVQDAEQQTTIALSGSYFLKHFPMDDKTILPAVPANEASGDLLKSVEFQNNVLLRVLNREELLDSYQRADSIATLLKTDLVRKTSSN